MKVKVERTHEPIRGDCDEAEAEIKRLRDLLDRAQPAVLNYYLLTGGQFLSVLNDMRNELALSDDISDQERSATARKILIDTTNTQMTDVPNVHAAAGGIPIRMGRAGPCSGNSNPSRDSVVVVAAAESD